jgi:hypothetical protein
MTGRWAIILVATVLIQGCANDVWVKPGATQADFQIAKGRCISAAYNAVQPAMSSMPIGGGYTTPTYTTCSGNGYLANCTTSGGTYIPPVNVPVDLNQNARNEVFKGCMYSGGWTLVPASEAAKMQTGTTLPTGTAPTRIRCKIPGQGDDMFYNSDAECAAAGGRVGP